MKHSINNQLQYNLPLDKLNKILTEETREIEFNPVNQYNALADGDKIALAHLNELPNYYNKQYGLKVFEQFLKSKL